MDRKDAVAWVMWLCTGCLRKSQAKTLSELVAAAMAVGRLSLAELGRASRGSAWAKHRIKRVWRFIVNGRIESTLVIRSVIGRLLRRYLKRLKGRPLLVSLDWTKIRQMHVLMAAVVVQGRAIPLCWASYSDKTLGKSQNALEEGLLLALKEMLGSEVRVILLADRGFGRTELGRFCQRYGFAYVIRIQAKVQVHIGPRRQAVRLDLYPVKKGMSRLLKDVLYRQHDPLRQHVVVRWKPGLPKRSDQPWYLMTNLDPHRPHAARRISDLYAKRFDIEELFRDTKCGQFGWMLSKTRVTRPDRFDRLLLIAVLAYLLLVGIGLWARRHLPPRTWASNNRPDECSAFFIGRFLVNRRRLHLRQLLNSLLLELRRLSKNWG